VSIVIGKNGYTLLEELERKNELTKKIIKKNLLYKSILLTHPDG
jgi:hypothetical protein